MVSVDLRVFVDIAVTQRKLGRTLDLFKVPQREKDEALGAFAAHKDEVTEGYMVAAM